MVGAVETGWGGSRAAPGRKHVGMIRFAGDAAADAGAARCGTVPGTRLPRIRQLQDGADLVDSGRSQSCTVLAMRHGMRPSHRAIRPKPRSTGEAGASHKLRTTATGQRPRRSTASFSHGFERMRSLRPPKPDGCRTNLHVRWRAHPHPVALTGYARKLRCPPPKGEGDARTEAVQLSPPSPTHRL